MNSSAPIRLVSDNNLLSLEEKKSPTNRLSLNLQQDTLATLSTLKTELESHPNPLNWSHLTNNDITENFSLDELIQQFNLLEDILTRKHNEEKHRKDFFTKERDQLKIAIEYYKLAIMQAALDNLCHEEKQNDDNKKTSYMKHGFYYALLLGGSWVAYLHGYDAAQAIGSLLPFGIPSSLMWVAGSAMFLVALGLFSSFEAAELKKHMGFSTAKNLKTTLEINQKQIEVTHEFAKHLVLHSEQKHIATAEAYRPYANLLATFNKSINKTKSHVESFKEGLLPKVAKNTLLLFGMVFTAADEIFLAIGFGALALSGPWGWVLIAGTALIGAALFYVAFHDMVRDKVAPTLKQKEDILEKHVAYTKDNLQEAVHERLAVKSNISQLNNKITELEAEIERLKNDKNLSIVSQEHISLYNNDFHKIKQRISSLDPKSVIDVQNIQADLLKLTQRLKHITNKFEKNNIVLRKKLSETQMALKRAEDTIRFQNILLDNKNEQIAILKATQSQTVTRNTSPSSPSKKSSALGQLSCFSAGKTEVNKIDKSMDNQKSPSRRIC